jgi:hypothetical protein
LGKGREREMLTDWEKDANFSALYPLGRGV